MLRQIGPPLLVGVILAGFGTSNVSYSRFASGEKYPASAKPTSSGWPADAGELAGDRIAELRRLSGLTWEQLARLFGVSRRALHFWASGKTMTAANEEHLARVLAIVRMMDRGSPEANRAGLLEVDADGRVPLDLLADGKYELVSNRLSFGALGGAAKIPGRSLRNAGESQILPAGVLAGALQDKVHKDVGRGRAAKSVRTRGGV